MTHLLLARHAETVWHQENRYAGRADIPLSARGYEQAGELGKWAASAGLTAIWVSPLQRARQTAEPSERATGLTAVVDLRLQEVGYGKGEGLTRAELERLFPKELAAFEADPAVHYLPGGENPREATDRALACFEEIAHKNPDGRVLVVTHKTLIRLGLCALMGVPLSRFRSIFPSIENSALTEIRIAGRSAALLRFNAPVKSLADAAIDVDER